MSAASSAAINAPSAQIVNQPVPARVLAFDAKALDWRMNRMIARLERAAFRRMTVDVIRESLVVLVVEEVALTTPRARAAWDAVCDELTVRRLEADQRARR